MLLSLFKASKFKTCFATALMAGTLCLTAGTAQAERSVKAIKADILQLAKQYSGKGDPDFSKQNTLNVLVDELLQASPQAPVKQRLKQLYGSWRQVWGPYEFGGKKRGVDPKLTPSEMYQVVSPNGYLYNISPVKGKEEITLLRGTYSIVSNNENYIKVKFTNIDANKGRPKGKKLWQLADMAEKDQLPNKSSVLPGFFVKTFLGGGLVREVYSDKNMRITYGSKNKKDRKNEYIYILVRVGK